MGTEAGRGRFPIEREISKLEGEKAVARLKCGITAEMLKYGVDAVVEWML